MLGCTESRCCLAAAAVTIPRSCGFNVARVALTLLKPHRILMHPPALAGKAYEVSHQVRMTSASPVGPIPLAELLVDARKTCLERKSALNCTSELSQEPLPGCCGATCSRGPARTISRLEKIGARHTRANRQLRRQVTVGERSVRRVTGLSSSNCCKQALLVVVAHCTILNQMPECTAAVYAQWVHAAASGAAARPPD